MGDKIESYKKLILEAIRRHPSKGISTIELSKILQIDRWTVGDICRDFVSEKYVKDEKRGNKIIYFPLEKAFNPDSHSLSLLFKKKTLSSYFNKTMLLSSEDQLQNFITKMGVFIVYVFLTTINSKSIDEFEKEIKTKDKKYLDKKVYEWISNIISPSDLFNQFRFLFSLNDTYQPALDDEHEKKDANSFQVNQSKVDTLLNELSRLHPNYIKELKNIHDNLKDYMYEELRHLKTENCNHHFIRKKESESTENKGLELFRCETCKKVVVINKEHTVTINQLRKDLAFLISKDEKGETKSKILDMQSKCNMYDRKHIVEPVRMVFDKDTFRKGNEIQKKFACKICQKSWLFTIKTKQEMQKMLDEVKELIGYDRSSLNRYNAFGNYIKEHDDDVISADGLTLAKFPELINEERQKNINKKEFEKDKKNILKILDKNGFIKMRRGTDSNDLIDIQIKF